MKLWDYWDWLSLIASFIIIIVITDMLFAMGQNNMTGTNLVLSTFCGLINILQIFE
jgi:hypothetical protein